MTAPASLRFNVNVPFPALVQGSGPVTITKQNGIWTVGFQIANLATQIPPAANYATDYLLVWDSVAQIFFKVPLSSGGRVRVQRSVTSSPIVIGATDEILNVNINAGSPTCALPTAASRNGLPLTFKDVGGHCAAHNLTITPNGAETIDGLASITMVTNFQSVTLVPFNDGINSGWSIE